MNRIIKKHNSSSRRFKKIKSIRKNRFNLPRLYSRVKKIKTNLFDFNFFKLLSWRLKSNLVLLNRMISLRKYQLSSGWSIVISKKSIKDEAKKLYIIYILYIQLLKKKLQNGLNQLKVRNILLLKNVLFFERKIKIFKKALTFFPSKTDNFLKMVIKYSKYKEEFDKKTQSLSFSSVVGGRNKTKMFKYLFISNKNKYLFRNWSFLNNQFAKDQSIKSLKWYDRKYNDLELKNLKLVLLKKFILSNKKIKLNNNSKNISEHLALLKNLSLHLPKNYLSNFKGNFFKKNYNFYNKISLYIPNLYKLNLLTDRIFIKDLKVNSDYPKIINILNTLRFYYYYFNNSFLDNQKKLLNIKSQYKLLNANLKLKDFLKIFSIVKKFNKANKSRNSNLLSKYLSFNLSTSTLLKKINIIKKSNIKNTTKLINGIKKVNKGTLEIKLMNKPFKNQYDFVGFVVEFLGVKNNKKYSKAKYLELTKFLKRCYSKYKKEYNRNAKFKEEFNKNYKNKLMSVFGQNYNFSKIKKFNWRSLNFKPFNYKVMFLDRFVVLRDLNKFYFKFRKALYYNYLYNKGISFKMLKKRIKFADPQDKRAPVDKSKKNTVIIDNKDRNKFVYYRKGQIIIENKNKNKSNNSIIIDNQIKSKNKIILDTTNKNKIIIDNKDKNKRVSYDRNKIMIESVDKKKKKFRINDLDQPVSLILKKPAFGLFLNSLNKNDYSIFNLAFLSKEFKKLLFLNSLETKRLSGLTSFESGVNGFFVPFVLNKHSNEKNTQYGFFIPFFTKFNFKGIKINRILKRILFFTIAHLKRYSFISLKDLKNLKTKYKGSIKIFFKSLYSILLKYGFPFGRFVSENAKNVLHKNKKLNLFFYKMLWVLICRFLYKDKSFLLSLRPMLLNKFFELIKKTNKTYNTMVHKRYYLPFFDKSISTELDNKTYNKFFNKYHIYKNYNLNNNNFLNYKKSYKFTKLSSKKKYYNFFFKVFYAKYIPFEKTKNYKRLQKLLTSKKHYHKYIIRKYTSKYCRFSYFFKYLFKSKNKRFKKRLTKRAYCFKRLRRLKKGIKKFNKKKAKKLYRKLRKPQLRFWLRKMRKSVVSALRKQLISFFFGINTLILKDLFFNKKVKYLHHFFYLHNIPKKNRYKKFPKSIYMPGDFISYKFNNYMKYGNKRFNKKFNLRFFTVKKNALNYHKVYSINSLNFFY